MRVVEQHDAAEPGVFGDAELALLKQVAANITFALQYLRSKESAEYLEYYDTLTGLPNRALYLTRVQTALESAQKGGESLAVAVIDIVEFGTVTTDAEGSFHKELVIPSHLPPGTYEFRAIGDETLTVALGILALLLFMKRDGPNPPTTSAPTASFPPAPPIPAGMAKRIVSALEPPARPKRRLFIRPSPLSLAAAAGLLVILPEESLEVLEVVDEGAPHVGGDEVEDGRTRRADRRLRLDALPGVAGARRKDEARGLDLPGRMVQPVDLDELPEPDRRDRDAEPPVLVSHRGGRFDVRSRGFWGDQTGPNPTDRRKCGSKHHIITDAQGIPLAVVLTGANRHDVTQLIPLVDGIPPVRGKRGRPRKRPERVQGDRGYDSEPHRKQLRQRKIEPLLAKRNTEHGSGLGVHRWVVERTLAWFHQFRRLRTRYDRRADIHEAFMSLGCAMICLKYLN